MSPNSAYERVYRDGHVLNRRTLAMLEASERRSGVRVLLIQGSYNTSVSASGGTHEGGGAWDVWPVSGSYDDAVRFTKAARQTGVAQWIRSPNQGPWGYHCHGICIADKQLSPAARQQVVEYYAGYDGLAGSGRDYGWRPRPIPVFHYGRSLRRKLVDSSRILRQIKIRTHKKPVMGVKALQGALNDHGWNLTVDGVAGPKTRHAFRHWRKKHDLGPYRAIARLAKGHFRARR